MNKSNWKTVIATSFADPADVRRYREAKNRGLSDREAFKYGDNGIGAWGADTTAPRAMVALPPEEWRAINRHPAGALVRVRRGDREIVAELQDTMPALKNIKNGAGIDMNPAACLALGISIPARCQVEWRWNDSPRTIDKSPPSNGITIGELGAVLANAIKWIFGPRK